VFLQKSSAATDVYHITSIIEKLETANPEDKYIAVKVALGLCLGGNDFIPKLYMTSHKQILQLYLQEQRFRDGLFNVNSDKIQINEDIFYEFVKCLYCPKRFNSRTATFEEVRKSTIVKQNCPKDKTVGLTDRIKNPQQWLPPISALKSFAQIIQLQVDYLMTAGNSNAALPDFLAEECLQKTSTGEVEYNFGVESHMTPSDLENLVMGQTQQQHANTNLSTKRKRTATDSPQKGKRRKVQAKALKK
jgi:hypothetical protein